MATLHAGLDLAHGAGEHRDDALVVARALALATLLGAAPRAGLALASSSQELLLHLPAASVAAGPGHPAPQSGTGTRPA